MNTTHEPDPTTSTIRTDYTTPSDYSMSSDQTTASAWSSSPLGPLGDPAADDPYPFDQPDEFDPPAQPRAARKIAVLAAALLATVGVGAALGIAIFDYTSSAPAPPAVVPAATPQPAALPPAASALPPAPAALVPAPSPAALPPAPSPAAVSAPAPAAAPADSGLAPADSAPVSAPAPV